VPIPGTGLSETDSDEGDSAYSSGTDDSDHESLSVPNPLIVLLTIEYLPLQTY